MVKRTAMGKRLRFFFTMFSTGENDEQSYREKKKGGRSETHLVLFPGMRIHAPMSESKKRSRIVYNRPNNPAHCNDGSKRK